MTTKVLYALLLLAPITLILELTGIGGHAAVFSTSALAMIPLAALLGRATEDTAIYTGPKIGSLLNATLGNAPELIITIVALREGLVNVVKASIAGSIVGNILIVLGASMLAGGLKHGTQTFDRRAAGTSATLMLLAIIALMIPAIFALGDAQHRLTQLDIERLSDGVAIVLVVLYGLYLFYSLREATGGHEVDEDEVESASMKLPQAIGLMAGSTLTIVVMSELLVGALEPTAQDWGLTDLFIGVMLVPLVGNVAEHFVAVQVAMRNKMDLSLGIALGSGLQIALFVTPVLVFAGIVMGETMTLVFNPFGLAALVGASLIAVAIASDGESNWLAGAQLLALYAILGIAFFFVP